MDNPQVSIIVPIYNSGQYLRECIESIIIQSFNDFELLLIDDGSIDNSSEICKSFSDKDKRVRYYYKANSGVSDTRNYGINLARGNYLCFIDSDDTVDVGFLEGFGFINNKADLYIQGYKKIINSKLSYLPLKYTGDNKRFDDILAYAERNTIINSPWAKLFKMEIVKNNNISFDVETSFGEDHLFVLEYILNISTIMLCNINGYNYQIRGNESLTGRNVPSREVVYYANKMKVLHELIIKKNNSKILKEAFGYSYYYNFIRALRYYFKSNDNFNDYSFINKSFDFDDSNMTFKSIGCKGLIFLIITKVLPYRLSHKMLRLLFV